MTTTSTTWRPPTEYGEQLRELYGLTCPPLWGTPRRLEHPTLGGKLAKVMTRLGYPPMPWQRYVGDVALEIDPSTGIFVHRTVGLSVPRQQGKTQELLGVMVQRMMAWQRQRVVYAAQARQMARDRWEDEFLVAIDASPLAPRFRSRKANGHEALICKATRSLMGITSNTETAGHGPPLDLGVIDEAFAHKDDRLEQAMSPAMLTRKTAQLWWASAGGTEDSIWLNKKRKAGRELIEHLWLTGQFPTVAYFEWFAPEDMDRTSPKTWAFCMPALGHTVDEDTVRAELDSMDPAEFDRAYLNRTRKAVPPPDVNVPRDKWPGLVDKASRPNTAAVAFALDVSPLRDWTSIAAASIRDDGRIHLELVDRRPGTDWAVPAMQRLAALWKPVAVGLDVPSRSPAGSLLDALIAAGIVLPEDPDKPQRGQLWLPRMGELVSACGQFADGMRTGALVHTDQLQLTAAVNGATTRPLGDAWAWKRRSAQVDISPLVASTIARAALLARLPLITTSYDPLANIW